jgi:hypothetical protein
LYLHASAVLAMLRASAAADQQAAHGSDDSQQLEKAQQLHQAMRQALNKLPALR